MPKEIQSEELIDDANILSDQIKIDSEKFQGMSGIFDLETYPDRLLLARMEGFVEGIRHAVEGDPSVRRAIQVATEGESLLEDPILSDLHSRTGLGLLRDVFRVMKLRYPEGK